MAPYSSGEPDLGWVEELERYMIYMLYYPLWFESSVRPVNLALYHSCHCLEVMAVAELGTRP